MQSLRRDGGFASLQFIAGAGFVLLVFVVAVNFIVVMYARGVMHSAADEGARAGSRASGGADVCARRADEALDVLLGGSLGNEIAITCTDSGGSVAARGVGTFHSWLVFGWEWTFEVESEAVKERNPI